MLLKLSSIVNSKTVLEKINSENFSSKTSFIIQRNIKKINEELMLFDEEKEKLVAKYAKKQNGDIYFVGEESKESFIKEFADLLKQEIEINIIQISLEDFDCKISPAEMSQIEWMFIFD